MQVTVLSPDEIVIGDRLRSVNQETVERLKDSIARIGLKMPISVRYLSADEGWLLVAGLHRLQACIELGLAEVPVREETGTELDARMWEIAENLHRAELTVLERSEHVAEWVRLAEERKGAQVAPPGGKQPHDKGIKAATRELGIERTEAQRATKIDAITPEAKAEAKILHLDNNQSALLRAGRQPTKEEQLRALREEAARKADRRDDVSASERRIEAVVKATKSLSPEELFVYLEWVDVYRSEAGATVFDNTAAGARR